METATIEEKPRRLADFLRTHRETILSDWLTAVRSLAPARGLDRPMLIDHLPQFLDDLADFLDEVRAGPRRGTVAHLRHRPETWRVAGAGSANSVERFPSVTAASRCSRHSRDKGTHLLMGGAS